MQSSIEANREAQRVRVAWLLRSEFTTQAELDTLKRLAGLVESADAYKLLAVSNHIHRIGRAVGKRRDAYRPLDILC
jgi:hypothetical protein